MRRRIAYLVAGLACVALLVLGSLLALATSPRLSVSLGHLLARPLGGTPVPYMLTDCTRAPLHRRWTCATQVQAVAVEDPASGAFVCGKSLPSWQMPRRHLQLHRAVDQARQTGLPMVCPPSNRRAEERAEREGQGRPDREPPVSPPRVVPC